ncbi:MAG TPA: glycosyltransferase family A protein [Promineifilum sp.]
MFCSTIIPTIGRQSLSRAVDSVLRQDLSQDEFEVVVVNDSGQGLPYATWQSSDRVRVIDTNRRERSVARNVGSAVARGRFLHFLDDDDWLFPGALAQFQSLSQTRSGAWYHGNTQLVDRGGRPLIQLQHDIEGNGFIQVMAGEWIPLQASMIESGLFFETGGFNPLIAGPEDIDLCRRIALRGNFVHLDRLVAGIEFGENGSTTDQLAHPDMSREAREIILNEPNAFERMRDSASSDYWHGRIVRAYLTSAMWNLQHKRPFTALSRSLYGVVGLVLAFRHFLSRSFWRAVSRRHDGEAFRRGLSALNAVTAAPAESQL